MIIFIVSCFSNLASAQAPSHPFENGEVIKYDIFYHWGIIWKRAATGVLRIDEANYLGYDAYKMNLACRTLNFADRIMRVRDTLNAYTTLQIKPLYYAKIANEGKYWAKDLVYYRYKNNETGGKITLLRRNRLPQDTMIWVEGRAYDMLSVFYYMRSIDFGRFNMNHTLDIPIFTGRKVITMRVTYKGKTILTLHNDKQYPSLRINLSFLNDDNLKDEDPPIEVWLSNDTRKIPLKVEGKLPIGSLQAEYVGH